MGRFFALILILVLLTACTTDNKEAITKAEDLLENAPASISPALTEMEIEDDLGIEFIEFDNDSDHILIDIRKVPILYEFLSAHQNPQQAVMSMELEKLEFANENIYTLRFSCIDNRCSHLLFHEDTNKQTFLVADMAQFISSYNSPDQSKIALQFSRSGEDMLPLSNIVVFDIDKWQPHTIVSEETSNILNYKWPFISVEWIDDDSIAITIPELIDLNKDSYEEWSHSEANSVHTVIYQIKDE